MKIINSFYSLENAKKYALDNVQHTNQALVIMKQTGSTIYTVSRYDTDCDIPMIVDLLQEYMSEHNQYIEGFSYYHRGWNGDCKLYVDINY